MKSDTEENLISIDYGINSLFNEGVHHMFMKLMHTQSFIRSLSVNKEKPYFSRLKSRLDKKLHGSECTITAKVYRATSQDCGLNDIPAALKRCAAHARNKAIVLDNSTSELKLKKGNICIYAYIRAVNVSNVLYSGSYEGLFLYPLSEGQVTDSMSLKRVKDIELEI